MTESNNPYESPAVAVELEPNPKLAERKYDIHKLGMISLVLATVLVVAIECLIFEIGFCLIFGPPILFFVLAFWSVIAGTSSGTKPIWLRIVLALVASVLVVPCLQFLFMVTCISASQSVEAGWSIHGGIQNNLLHAFVSCALIAIFAFILFLFAYLLPKHLRTINKPSKDLPPNP